MSKPTRITLVRHGETIWNREQRLQGSQDIPLSEKGLQQAERVAARLKDETAHAVYSSHLQRAHKTAEMIAAVLTVPHHVHPHLHERSYGEVEGWTRTQILERYPNFWGPDQDHVPIQGLETFAELCERAYAAIDHIAVRHSGKHVLVVSHGGTINAFLHKISQGDFGTGVNKLGNTSITRVIREHDGTWQIEEVGCTKHLDADE
jgi:broad specificity phosphatase PhoE